ncbi:DUF6161 domain-containing protein [Aureimonas mangrovi]|uniref:DUF6161 domain-containing protein n=1 Tax=Aureimonas mangrovi TaxID=2758041 RepID=UPI00163D8173|nr:DUF6161 domain-containing protein [Aureimonas mangrovi]
MAKAFYAGPSKDFGGQIIVRQRSDIAAAVAAIGKAYSWLPGATGHPNIKDQARQLLDNRLNALRKISNLTSNDDQVRKLLDDALNAPTSIPVDGSRDLKLIDRLREVHGDNVAASALLHVMGGSTALGGYQVQMGATAVTLVRLGLGNDFAESTRKSVKRVYDQFRRQAAQADAARDEYTAKMGRHVSRQLRIHKAVIKRFKASEYVRRENFDEAQEGARNEIGALISLYQEHLKLKAPVDYWTQKASQHRSQSIAYRNLASKAGLSCGVLLLVFLAVLAKASLNYAAADANPSTLLIFATMGVVATTGVLWAMRIIVRLFLSEHHLAIDAEERATMALTYLALTAEDKVDTEDRQLVLASLFRPTADGIVKDDAAPVFGPSGILSSMATR